MRNSFALVSSVLIGASILSGGAAAQQSLRTPVIVSPPVMSGQVASQLQDALQNRPKAQRFTGAIGGSFSEPPLTAAITRRKQDVLRAMGLNVQASNLGAPVHLSPMRHTVDASTYMAFSGSPPTLALPPTTTLSGAVNVSPKTFVELNFRSANPFAYHLVECVFEGSQVRDFHYTAVPRYESDTGFARPAGSRFAALIPPHPTAARQLAFVAIDSDLQPEFFASYILASCEITPVIPKP